MASLIIAKAAEVESKVPENGVRELESGETGEHGELGKKLPDLENIGDKIEFPKEGRPPIDIIKTESLQQLIEESKSKINEVRNALNENPEKIESDDAADNLDESDNASEDEEGTGDNDENKEISEDEINEKQKAAIKDAIERIRNGEKLTNEELGNLGEMMMDQYYISKGYKPLNKHRVTSLDDKKGGFRTGIDGVYEKANSDGTKSYVISDAKYNTSQLSETNDGKQMSDNWIDKRLDDAVGKEKADEIRDVAEDNPDSVNHEVYHIDPNIDENGNIHTDVQEVDPEGNKVGDKTIVEYFDEDGNRVEPSDDN